MDRKTEKTALMVYGALAIFAGIIYRGLEEFYAPRYNGQLQNTPKLLLAAVIISLVVFCGGVLKLIMIVWRTWRNGPGGR